MQKSLLLGIVALMVVGLLASVALAAELDVWYFEDNQLIDQTTGPVRAFKAGSASGACNAFSWDVDWSTTASVAQWLEFDFTGTEWNWYVRKPGDYYTDCIEVTGKSNGSVTITFDGFGNLEYQGTGVGQDYIETWYAAAETQGELISNPSLWVPAEEMGLVDWNIPEDPEHNVMTTKLWNRINVVECNSASEYENSGTITITLDNQKDWLHEDGSYDL